MFLVFFEFVIAEIYFFKFDNNERIMKNKLVYKLLPYLHGRYQNNNIEIRRQKNKIVHQDYD